MQNTGFYIIKLKTGFNALSNFILFLNHGFNERVILKMHAVPLQQLRYNSTGE